MCYPLDLDLLEAQAGAEDYASVAYQTLKPGQAGHFRMSDGTQAG
jgi:hypothetical protein